MLWPLDRQGTRCSLEHDERVDSSTGHKNSIEGLACRRIGLRLRTLESSHWGAAGRRVLPLPDGERERFEQGTEAPTEIAHKHKRNTLYVFLDESGNFDFSNKGTQHFVMSGVYTTVPCETAAPLQALKYELMAQGSDQLEFHATTNSRGTRRRVTKTISSLQGLIGVKTFYVDKHYTHPSRQSPESLLAIFGSAFAKWIAKVKGPDVDQIILIFDSVLTGKQQKAFLGSVKPLLKELAVPYRIAFHPVKSDLNGQIADYFAWSTYRWLESKDDGPLTELSAIEHSTFDLFQNGHTKYY